MLLRRGVSRTEARLWRQKTQGHQPSRRRGNSDPVWLVRTRDQTVQTWHAQVLLWRFVLQSGKCPGLTIQI